jgi:hypothetical protein
MLAKRANGRWRNPPARGGRNSQFLVTRGFSISGTIDAEAVAWPDQPVGHYRRLAMYRSADLRRIAASLSAAIAVATLLVGAAVPLAPIA